MDQLEKGSGNTVLSEREAQALLKDDEDLVLAVYDYWLAKRLRLVKGFYRKTAAFSFLWRKCKA